MPKFGWCKFAEEKLGDRTRHHDLKFRMANATVLGLSVRGTIRKRPADTTKAVTYRLRRGNGHYSSVLGKLYQDKYNYPDVSNLANNFNEGTKANLKAAVSYWLTTVTTEEKTAYNKRAQHPGGLSGYNLFLREALRGEIHMFVDRGDPATYDFDKEDLTIDGAWHSLDLSNIVPKTARLILLKTRLKSANPGDRIRYREDGNTNEINICSCEALRANISRRRMGTVAISPAQVIEYNADDITWAELDIVIRGWWN